MLSPSGMTDLYGYEKRKKHAEERLNASSLSDKNKRLVKDFLLEYGTDKSLSIPRQNKYLSNFRIALEILNMDLDSVSVQDIRGFVNNIRNRKILKNGTEMEISETTKEDYMILFKTFFKWYKKRRELSPSLREAIEYLEEYSFKIDRNKLKEPDILTPQEVKLIISEVKSIRDKCLISIIWDSGGRIGEVLSLRNKDIIPFQHGYKINMQKSKTFKRNLPLIESSPYIRAYANDKGESFRNGNEPFFIDQYGKALSYDGVRILLKRAMERTGLNKRLYAHLFRHSRATYLANMGWSEQQLCKWFGWVVGSEMPRTYIKRSGIDIEEPMLELQGIESRKREELKSELKPLKCVFCGEVNEATNNFCKVCNKPLRPEEIQRLEQERESMFNEMTKAYMKQKETELLSNERFIARLKEEIKKELMQKKDLE